MLLNQKRCFDVYFKKIIWCYGENAAKPNIKNVTFVEGLPQNLVNVGNKPMLVILDDLIGEVYNSKINELFYKGSHHRNISVILVTQNFFHKSPHSRGINLNAKYIILFKNPRDTQQFQYLARQVAGINAKELCKVFNEVTRAPHGYLILDLSQEINENLRFRTDIFSPDYLAICFSNLSNFHDLETETIEGEQAYAICS